MRMIHRYIMVTGLAVIAAGAAAHGIYEADPADSTGRAIDFPDTAEYLTLTLDPHTHSVFSDGHVWPYIRVGEALRDDLDAYAVTEHLEWQPHRAQIPHADRNTSWRESVAAAEGSDLIVINGSEITRDLPSGHINALFIEDANALLRKPEGVPADDTRGYYNAASEWPPAEALRAANAQGAFVFLNHVYWTSQRPDGIARLTDFHREMIDAGLVHGIEVANGDTYSEESFAIALEHDLTIIGTSDIHDLIDWDYAPHAGGHRPVTLVLAEERSEAAIKAALEARRTVAWYRNLLIGRSEHLLPILSASMTVEAARYLPDTQVLEVSLRNDSDARFQLMNESGYTLTNHGDLFELAPHASTVVEIRTGEVLPRFELSVRVMNALVAPKEHPLLVFTGEVR